MASLGPVALQKIFALDAVAHWKCTSRESSAQALVSPFGLLISWC